MEKIVVEGKNRLEGELEISGMKNSALPIIFACLLIKDECIIDNAPRVSDVENSLTILREMGAEASFVGPHTVKINTSRAENVGLRFDLISKMRASSYLMSTMPIRFGSLSMPYPGGCNFGVRPIDLHISGLKCLGIECDYTDSLIELKCGKKSKNTKITLDKISVGATINMIMASVLMKGITIIENVAREPHVHDLACFLNKAGANISFFDDKIMVIGVNKLKGVRHRIYSDMIEALTFVSCVGVTKGHILMKNMKYEHLQSLKPVFDRMNIILDSKGSDVEVRARGTVRGVDITTSPYPGFPTDMHPQMSALLCYCKGGGSVKETLFTGRFAYINELKKMGAKIEKLGDTVKIKKSRLYGAQLDATDLRAGAALIVSALGASGTSTVSNVNYIVRGYESIVSKLSSVGANIKLI